MRLVVVGQMDHDGEGGREEISKGIAMSHQSRVLSKMLDGSTRAHGPLTLQRHQENPLPEASPDLRSLPPRPVPSRLIITRPAARSLPHLTHHMHLAL